MPAVRTEHHQSRATEMDVAMEQGNATSSSGFLHNGAANGYTNEHTNGYANEYPNGHANGYANGHSQNSVVKSSEPVPTSQNF
jgi:hypothetical protein